MSATLPAFASPAEETARILEQWTSFHWGRDCLVWVVHYPEELVSPWTEAEAERVGMSAREKEAYRDHFISELRLDSSEAFLLSVYPFGAGGVSFAPLSEKISLLTDDGRRLKPFRYDSLFDQPISGIVQGLVFFPKQDGADFKLALRGMGIGEEQLFVFGSGTPDVFASGLDTALDDESEVVVIDLPPRSTKTSRAGVKRVTKAQVARPVPVSKDDFPPLTPPAPPIVKSEPQVDERFISSLRRQNVSDDVDSELSSIAPVAPSSVRSGDLRADENIYVSREKTIRSFLELWKSFDSEGSLDGMYGMLSDSSRKMLSRDTFSAELRKSSDFRAALKDGYKIEWIDGQRAKVVAAKRMLMLRTLVARTFGVIREGSSWKIVW